MARNGRRARGADGSPVVGRVVLAGTLTVLLVMAACSDDESVAEPTTSRRSTHAETPTSTTSTTAPSVEEQLIERYQAFWDARFEANQEPVNPDHPGLREYATGAQLDNVLEETRQNAEDGIAFRRPANSVAESRVRVLEINGREATLQECVVNDGVVYEVATGEVVDDAVVSQSVRATMRRVEDVWKLADTRLLQEWEGAAGCALAEDF